MIYVKTVFSLHAKSITQDSESCVQVQISVGPPCCVTVVYAYYQWPVVFQQTRIPNSLPMGANYVDYEPQGTEVIQVHLQTTR